MAIGTLILIMFTFRIAIDSFSNRFLSDDLFGRLLYLVYAYGLALIVLDMDGADEHNCHYLGMQTDGFIIGYMICRAMSLVMLVTAMTSYKEVLPQYLYEFTIKVSVFLISLCMIGFRGGRPSFLLASNLFEFILLVPLSGVLRPLVTLKIFAYPPDTELNIVPLNIAVAQRRLCMWCMMILGESVIQLVEPDIDQSRPHRTYWYFTAGIILIFTYALLYCDSVLREHLDFHAMRRSSVAGVAWVWMHPVVGYAMFIIGVSIKLSFSSVVTGAPVSDDHNYMLGLGCGFTVICLLIMRGTHKGVENFKKDGFTARSLKRVANYFIRLVFAIAHFIVAGWSYSEKEIDENTRADSRDKALYIHATLAAGSVLLEMAAAQLSQKKQNSRPQSSHGEEEHGNDSTKLRTGTHSTASSSVEDGCREGQTVEMGSVN